MSDAARYYQIHRGAVVLTVFWRAVGREKNKGGALGDLRGRFRPAVGPEGWVARDVLFQVLGRPGVVSLVRRRQVQAVRVEVLAGVRAPDPPDDSHRCWAGLSTGAQRHALRLESGAG